MNSTFVAHLRSRIGDPRLTVLHRSAAEAEPALAQRGIGPVDLLVSGIPLSGMSPRLGSTCSPVGADCSGRAGCWWSISSPARRFPI